MSLKPTIATRFARSVESYDSHCEIQARVGETLANFLPQVARANVLELGCGTGIFTRHLFTRYPDARIVASDLCPDMVQACARRFGDNGGRTFQVLDADKLDIEDRFDVIASSMALHWVDDPAACIEKQRSCLKSGGRIVFATIGADNFPEWRSALKALGFDSGVRTMEALPGVLREERIAVDYGNARGFLNALKRTGAVVARPGYRPLTPTDLKRACELFDSEHAGRVTWHIVYGVVSAETVQLTQRPSEAVPAR